MFYSFWGKFLADSNPDGAKKLYPDIAIEIIGFHCHM